MKYNMTLADGRNFWLKSFTGEVIEERQWSETEVWSTPASGALDTRTGFVRGGGQNIHSQTYDKKSCWLRAADGKEEKFELVDFALDYRVGHKVTVVWGAVDGKETGPYLAAYNHNIQRGYIPTDHSNRVSLAKRSAVLQERYVWLQFLVIIGLVCTVVGIPLVFIGGIWIEARAQGRVKKFFAQLDKKFNGDILPNIQKSLSSVV